MKFEVGKTYLTRGGMKVLIIEPSPWSTPGFLSAYVEGSAWNSVFTSEGKMAIGSVSSEDIVSEYIPPVIPIDWETRAKAAEAELVRVTAAKEALAQELIDMGVTVDTLSEKVT